MHVNLEKSVFSFMTICVWRQGLQSLPGQNEILKKKWELLPIQIRKRILNIIYDYFSENVSMLRSQILDNSFSDLNVQRVFIPHMNMCFSSYINSSIIH